MNSEQQAPTIDSILRLLKLKSIQQLISGDAFNIETLAKTTSLHAIRIRQHLATLQSLLTPTIASSQQPSISLGPIFSGWSPEGSLSMTIRGGDIVEVIGRVGGGKSWLLNQIIVQALLKGVEVIFLDGGNNLNSLLYRISQQRKANSSFLSLKPRLRTFAFRNQPDLMMILQSLGQWHSNNQHARPWIFIDALSHNDDHDAENPQSSGTIEFKSADKARKLFFQLSQIVGAIIYTSKALSLSSLFDTIYKHEKHRPKGAGSCAKKWDNLASKTICLDFGRTASNTEYSYVNFSKEIDCLVHKFKRNP